MFVEEDMMIAAVLGRNLSLVILVAWSMCSAFLVVVLRMV